MYGSVKPLPIDAFLPDIILCESDSMYITIPKSNLNFSFLGTHAHGGYEFIIPLTSMPYLSMDGKIHAGHKNQIYAINPGQEHGVLKEMENIRLIDILIDQNYMSEAANDVYHKGSLEFHVENYPASSKMQTMIKAFIEESMINAPGKTIQLQSLSTFIAVLLLREIRSNLSDLEPKLLNVEDKRIRLSIDYIHDNCESDLSLSELANIAGMSRYHFIRVFKNNTGKTPYEYVLDVKLEKAKGLLANRNIPVIDVCFECGFNNVSHFTSLFKKKMKVTPSSYRSMILD